MTGLLARLSVSAVLAARDLVRNRVAVGLVIAVPTVFFLLIHLTTGERPIQFQLSAAGSGSLAASERDVSMLFIAMAAISGVQAFLAMTLVFRPLGADHRLVFEGYRPGELLFAKAVVMIAAAAVVAAYVTALLPVFFTPRRPSGVFLGFLLTSLVYGTLGMAVGATVRRDLEGILFIILLVNVDAGWLQNPVFYGHAQNQELIRALPGHHPGQVAMRSAFTQAGVGDAVAWSLAYGAAGFAIAGALFWLRVRVRRYA